MTIKKAGKVFYLKGIYISLLLLLLISLEGNAQSVHPAAAMQFPADYPVIHPQFRQWPSPAMGTNAGNVSPYLYWPADRKNDRGYDIRLSQDSLFETGSVILAENIPYTLYNPYRQLAVGNWYWQYRVHGKSWSSRIHFRVDELSQQQLPPAPSQFLAAISDPHPRVLLTKSDQQDFASREGSTEDGLKIINAAARYLKKAPLPEHAGEATLHGKNEDERRKMEMVASQHASTFMFNAIELFCKSYFLTLDKKYQRAAIRWGMALAAWDPNGVSHESDFGDARCMLGMAYVFDSFHEALSEKQASILKKAIGIRANRIYNEWINNIDAKVLSNHVWQYILHYFIQTGLAVKGELPDADRWLSYAYELFMARAPVLGAGDGGWQEGASYFRLNMETLIGIPIIIRNYTGYDFFKTHEWYQRNPVWMAYSVPAGSYSDGFGDDVEKLHTAGADYLGYADALSRLTGNRLAAWYAGKIETIEGLKLSDDSRMRWIRMRYLRNLSRPVPIDESTLAMSALFPGSGVADFHAHPAEIRDNVMVSFRSSNYGGYGHLLADQNTFNVLLGGKRLFYMSGYKVAMQDPHRLGWYKATQGHNGILIDGKGQSFDVEGYGSITAFLSGKELGYVEGDASRAYDSRAEKLQTGMRKFLRKLVFLQPGIVVIYDELEADHPAIWSWLIHSPHHIKINPPAGTFAVEEKGLSAQAYLTGSQALHWNLTDTFAVPAVNWLGRTDEEGNLIEYENNQWHLRAESSNRSNKMRYLSVICAGSTANEKNRLLQIDKSHWQIGDWIIEAELNTEKHALLQISNNMTQTIFSSSADLLQADGQSFSGKEAGTAKLLEKHADGWHFAEAMRLLPDAIREIPAGNIQKSKHR